MYHKIRLCSKIILILKIKKKMKKEYIVYGFPLIIIGVIGLFAWYSQPKKNKDGFYSASGGGCGCGAK